MASLPPKETSAEPPRTFKEFLLFHNLDDWPRFPYMPDMDDRPLLVQIRKDFPADALAKYLYDKAPLPIETISDLEKRVDDCKTKAHEHAKHVFSLEPKKSVLDDQMVSILNQADESQEVRNKKKVKIIAEPVQDSSCKSAENFKFPGFNLQKLTKLPNHLEPAQLWDSVLKTKVIRGVNKKMLKKLFISDPSLAVLQDCFWWWFLHKFKPDQDEQDRFFDRISDSFVVLLLNAPSYMKDPFFQIYPDCLSQAIYITFCEAFPESQKRFDDQFKDELMDLIFQWIRGFKPRKSSWKEWKFWCSETTPENDSFHASSSYKKPLSSSKSRVKSLRFGLEKEKPKIEAEKPEEESHYIGNGPDFQRSLFNLGGQSPLVLYYLHVHGIANTLANSRAYRINHSEIYTIPPASPTYSDVIKESQTFANNLQSSFNDFDLRCEDELAELQHQRAKVNKKYERMMANVTKKPTEARLDIERFLAQMEIAKTPRAKSSGANSATEGLP